MKKTKNSTHQLLVLNNLNSTYIPRLFIIDDAAEKAGVTRRIWLHYWRWGLANSDGEIHPNQRHFDEDSIYRVRRAEQIRISMETNLKTAATIVQLLERIEGLERASLL
jgi:hypothetical protein